MIDRWQLFREDARLGRASRDLKKRLAQIKDPEERERISQTEGYELACWYAELEVQRTRQVARKCRKLFVPLPDPSDESMWDRSPFSHDRYLTTKGLHEVSKLLHDARQRNFDLWGRWIAAVPGLGGVLIGILSVWR